MVKPVRTHMWFGVAATALLPILIAAVVLAGTMVLLLALVIDGSVVLRHWGEQWRIRRSRTR